MLALAALFLLQAAPEPPLLTIGDPAPKLAPLTFLRGEPVAGFAPGTITLVEFSGTQCAPCVKAIPHLNAIQKKYPGVVVLSVFGEPEPDVRAYLAEIGKATEARVATDPTGATHRAWMAAAARVGIPACFLVSADGKVAWIGHPNNLDDPLARLIAGTFDTQQEALRQKVEQGAQRRREWLRRRADEARAEHDRIWKLDHDGKALEALASVEAAAVEYRDLPQVAFNFRNFRLGVLAAMPGRRDEAFGSATELAIEVAAGGRQRDMVQVAIVFQNAAERAPHDRRLLDLSLPLLRDEYDRDPDWQRQSADEKLFARAITIKFRARAHTLRGDAEAARECFRQGVELLEAAPAGDTGDRRKLLEEFRGGLKPLPPKP